MRRGSLGDIPVPEVLRTAARERLDGQLDFEGGRPASVYLTGGAVSLACWHDEVPDLGTHHINDGIVLRAHEHRARHLSVTVLRDLVARREGWYHHFPFGDHPAVGLWGWDVDDLLARVAMGGPAADPDAPPPAVPAGPGASGNGAAPAGRAPAVASGGPGGPGGPGGLPARPPGFGGGPLAETGAPLGATGAAAGVNGTGPGWRLAPTAPSGPVDGEAWTLLAAMAGEVSRDQVVARSGWPIEQVDAVLGRLAAQGLVVRAAGAGEELLGGRVRSRHDRQARRPA